MVKLRTIVVFLMVFVFCNVTLVINNPIHAEKLQVGQLNKIELNADKTFKVDILGSGTEQIFKITNTSPLECTLTISQQNNFLKIFTKNKTLKTFPNLYDEFGTGKWYIAYLRGNNIPDVIYYLVAGKDRFVNELLIIGKTKNGDIDILFNFRSAPLAERGYGRASAELSINGTQLILSNDFGSKVPITWDGNNFKYQ